MAKTRTLIALIALAAVQMVQPVQAQTPEPIDAETLCLAQALYYEARGEGLRGQEAIAEVILQRVHSSSHPGTICGVVYEPYQFSFVSDGSTLQKLSETAWKSAYRLAERVIHREVVTSLTRRALFFHEVSARPAWADSMVRTAQIGNHVFYRQAARTRS